MASVPVRASSLLLRSTRYDTVPFPVPLAPPVIVIHEEPLLTLAFHEQPAPAVTATVPSVARSEISTLLGLIEYVHGAGAGAACDTVNVWPPMLIVPLRAVPVLVATLYATEPLPDPVAPDVMVIQVVVVVAVHEHPAGDVTLIGLPFPAVAGTD